MQVVLKIRQLVTIILAAFVAGAKLGLGALDTLWNLTVEFLLKLFKNSSFPILRKPLTCSSSKLRHARLYRRRIGAICRRESMTTQR